MATHPILMLTSGKRHFICLLATTLLYKALVSSDGFLNKNSD